MNILVISNAFPRPLNRTMGTYVYDQVVEIKKLNKGNLFVISPSMYIPNCLKGILKKSKFKKFVLSDEYIIGDFNVISPKTFQYGKIFRKYPKLEYFFYKIKVLKFVENFVKKNNIDIIYSVGTFIEGHIAYDIYMKLNIPYVITEHSNSNILNSVKNKELYKKILQNAKKVFFVSYKSRKTFLKLYEDFGNTKVIVNGFKEEKNIHVNKKVSTKFKIISVGFLEKRKGWEYLLECMNELEKKIPGFFELKIVGDGPLRKKMTTYINNNNLNSICKFTGLISHKQVIEYMAESDLFCLVSTNEPLGIVYLEAMNVGLPIIGTKGEGISDIIENFHNGFLVDYGDVNELKNLIIKIINDKDGLKKISENGKKTALNYTWSSNARKWIKSIESIKK